MEKDIEILESECYYLEELGYLRENNHFIRFNQALENLIKAYKELEERLKIKKNTPEWEYQYWEARKEVDNEWKSKIKEIRDKAEVMDYYTLPDVIDDLNKLLEANGTTL